VVGREVGGEIAARPGQRAELLQNRSVRLVAPAKPFAQPLLLLGWQFFNCRFNFRNRAHAENVANQTETCKRCRSALFWGEGEVKQDPTIFQPVPPRIPKQYFFSPPTRRGFQPLPAPAGCGGANKRWNQIEQEKTEKTPLALICSFAVKLAHDRSRFILA